MWPTKAAARAQKTQSYEDEPVDDDPSKPTSIFQNWSEGEGEGGRYLGQAASGNAGIFYPRGFRGCGAEGDMFDICGGAGLRASIGAQGEHRRVVQCRVVDAVKYFGGRARPAEGGPFLEETVINGNPTSGLGLIKVFHCTVNLQRRLH